MPMTEKTQSGASKQTVSAAPDIAHDEQLAAVVSAYLDGELTGEDLEEFETLLRNNEALAREVAEMRRLDHELGEIGAEILSEPVPDNLLELLSGLRR